MEREEAINLIKQVLPCLNIDEKIREGFETLIPELKESEDERIRKNLIELLLDTPAQDIISHNLELSKVLAYLEKQKEQKHPDGCFTCDEYKKGYEEGRRNGFTAGYNKAMKEVEQKEQKPECDNETEVQKAYREGKSAGRQEVFDHPEEYGLQKEQKTAEWSEDYREEDIQTRFAFYTYKDDPSVLYLSNVFVEETSRNHGFGTRILKAAEKAAEAIGAITICLKVKQDSPANAWYRKRGYGYVAFEDGYDWLEKNLEYLKPAKSAEWSEEDKDMLNSCISSIEEAKENRYAYKETDGDTSYDHEIDWLKSLRPSWKPSEEQMEILQYVCTQSSHPNQKVIPVLESLYNDLKKL